MENSIEKLEKIFKHFKEYLNNHIQIIRIEIADKISGLASLLVAIICLSIFLFLAIIFVGISLALFFGEKTGSDYLGFFIVAGIYLIAAVLIWKGRNKLIRIPVFNSIINHLLK